MPIPLLGFLTSPIAKIGLGVVNKVVDGVKHKNELKEIRKSAELEAVKQIDFAKIEAQKVLSKAEAEVRKAQADGMANTWRDEAITIVYLSLLVAHFTPWTAPYMEQGWALLQNANEYFWWGLMAVIGGTFGLNLTNKLKK